MKNEAIIYLCAKIVASVAIMGWYATLAAQEKQSTNNLPHNYIIDYTQDRLQKAENLISTKLDKKDSLYVTPNIYNMTIMTQYSYNYEYYRFTAVDRSQSIAFRPDNGNKIGLFVGWKWLFLGWSFDLTKNSAKKDINLSFYTAKLGIDLFYRKRSEGFKIVNTEGFDTDKNYNGNFDGLSTRQKGFNIYYVFNNKRFSYPAAYSQSTNQRISAGSFILGISYNEQMFLFNYEKLDATLLADMSSELKFNEVNYKDCSITFGYSYNWVFAKNFLANISLTPGAGFKNSSLRMTSSKDFISNINFDLVTRAAVVYNNQKYYIGASLVSHTYSYRKSSLSVINGFGTVNVYAGFNFWRNKKVIAK